MRQTSSQQPIAALRPLNYPRRSVVVEMIVRCKYYVGKRSNEDIRPVKVANITSILDPFIYLEHAGKKSFPRAL
jgi:hypothetical protein